MAHILFDEEVLESLVYERSKTWSNFLKLAEKDDGVEINLDEIENFYKNDVEESIIGIDEAEETEEDDVEEKIKNISACDGKTDLTQMLYKGDDKEIINQTAPIVEEHVRKWKAAGLDCILDTFDTKKIEQHVGGWLRRHNSVYSDKTLLQQTPPKSCLKRYKNVARQLYSPDGSPDSETESMHSIETARYIRASRKRTVSFGSKCGSPMSTIKMYRTLPCKRDELRAKYSYDVYNDEQEHRHHMQALLYRRDQMHRRKRDIVFHTNPRHYPYSMANGISVQQRRKQLRKRRDSSPRFSSLSSSEDERGHDHCQCNACVRRMYRNYKINLRHSIRQMRHLGFDDDRRPRLMENDCSCCDSDRLCSNVVHIANSSTEDWLVENRSSPDEFKLCTSEQKYKERKTPKSKMHKDKINNYVHLKENISKKEIDVHQKDAADVKKTKSTSKVPESCKKNTNTLSSTLFKSPPLSKATPVSKAKVGFKEKNISKSQHKKAIAKQKEDLIEPPFSKDTPVSKSKTRVKEKNISKSPITQPIPKQKTNNQKSIKKVKKLIEESSDSSTKAKLAKKKAKSRNSESDDDFKYALKLSRETYMTKQKQCRQIAANELQTTLQLSDRSLFNNHSVACNSTALSNDTACRRALDAEKFVKQIKDDDAGRTLVPIIDLCDSTLESKNFKYDLDHDADCTVVTSTTGYESSKSAAKITTVAPQRSDIKLTQKGILLYSPPIVEAEPDHSQSNNTTNNGCFTLTEDCLSPIIGRRRAQKFFRYHVGSRTFNSSYSVYYRPTAKIAAVLSAEGKSLDLSSSSSGSEFDVFERVGRYGEIYTEMKK